MPAVLLYRQVYKSLHGRGNIVQLLRSNFYATILATIFMYTMGVHTHAHMVVIPLHKICIPPSSTYATSIVALLYNYIYFRQIYFDICDRICENVHSSHKNFNSFF